MNCPKCNAPVAGDAANFCEDCGAPLSANAAVTPGPTTAGAGACPGCGAGPEATDAAGFCTRCGLERQAAGNEHDHRELAASPSLGGVTDLGRKRLRNEDAFALATAADDGGPVLVVCDGISHSFNAAAAARAAAPAACEALQNADAAGDAEEAMRAALARAQAAVKALAPNPLDPEDTPATTVVAARVRGGVATLGWLGDCRAYWVGAGAADGARRLTKDHSWVNEVVDAGKLSYEEAMGRRGAHAVTRTLGGPPADPARGEAGDEPAAARGSRRGWTPRGSFFPRTAPGCGRRCC